MRAFRFSEDCKVGRVAPRAPLRHHEYSNHVGGATRPTVFVVLLLLSFAAMSHAQSCATYPFTGGINKWPQGVVPYVFEPFFSEAGKPAVRSAMAQWMDSGAAVAFVEYTSLNGITPHLRINQSFDGNRSDLGPRIPLTVAEIRGDIEVGDESHIVHELGHALGFPHEQSRPDRNTYVTVHRSRINPFYYPANFDIVAAECWPPGSLRQPYDYDSIMHYDWCLFGAVGCENGVQGRDDTMTATDSDYQYTMGGWIGDDSAGLSDGDIMKAKYVYGNAVWVDVNSDCSFEGGTRHCDGLFDSTGPYTTISDAMDDVPSSSDPGYTLMIKNGTYSTSGTLRITKPVKLVAYRGGVRLD